MNYLKVKDFMIKLGETSDNKIIEVPDIIVFTIGLLFIVILFALSNQKN